MFSIYDKYIKDNIYIGNLMSLCCGYWLLCGKVEVRVSGVYGGMGDWSVGCFGRGYYRLLMDLVMCILWLIVVFRGSIEV